MFLSRLYSRNTTSLKRYIHIGFRKMANIADSYDGM